MVRTRASANARRAIALAAATVSVPCGVVVQEDLLERGRAARESDDAMPGQRGDERTDASRHLAADAIVLSAGAPHAGEPFEVGRRPVEADLNDLRPEVAQVVERALVDEAALAQDAHAVANGFDLGEDVR